MWGVAVAVMEKLLVNSALHVTVFHVPLSYLPHVPTNDIHCPEEQAEVPTL